MVVDVVKAVRSRWKASRARDRNGYRLVNVTVIKRLSTLTLNAITATASVTVMMTERMLLAMRMMVTLMTMVMTDDEDCAQLQNEPAYHACIPRVHVRGWWPAYTHNRCPRDVARTLQLVKDCHPIIGIEKKPSHPLAVSHSCSCMKHSDGS